MTTKTTLAPEAYTAASRLLPGALAGLVRNEQVQPCWIGETGRFWYRRDGDGGPEFRVVEPDGATRPAFDHKAFARALAPALGAAADDAAVPAALAEVELDADLTRLSGVVGDTAIDCDLRTMTCAAAKRPDPQPGLLPCPTGRRALFVRDHNLQIRDLETGEERALTDDGEARFAWATLPEASLMTVARRKHGLVLAPFEATWSPDGRYVIAPQLDERSLGVTPFVEWTPTDGSRRPIVYEVRFALAGERAPAPARYALFDVETGERRLIDLPEAYAPDGFGGLVLGFSESRAQAFLLTRMFASRSLAVFRLDLRDAALVKVLEEDSPVRVETNAVEYHKANIRLLSDGAELIWYSARTGFGHLYLYDAQSGALKGAVTAGEYAVFDIEAVDEARREIFFTAGGREPGSDPYYRRLYRSSLDGGAEPTLLTPEEADHHFEPSFSTMMSRLFGATARAPAVHPAAGIFVDTWSTVGSPPVSALRSARDGRLIAELERADASALFATGWRPPLREKVKAADGVTDLYLVYYPPLALKPGDTCPVIDAVYGGPQVVVTPKNFIQAYRGGNPYGQSALSRLGFAVVTVDARGTPMRSRAFRDAGFPLFTQVGVDDHVAAIRALAERRPELDLDRVGLYGWSWGGTFAAQAILSRPEFYKVAVSGAGVYDYAAMYSGFESAIGAPVYADGSRYRGRADESPANWEPLDVTRLASALKGHLLIIYGDMDENVPPLQAFRLVDALTKANRPYDLLYLPNRTHAGALDPYSIKRTWDYFVEHLQGAAPPLEGRVELTRPAAPEEAAGVQADAQADDQADDRADPAEQAASAGPLISFRTAGRQ